MPFFNFMMGEGGGPWSFWTTTQSGMMKGVMNWGMMDWSWKSLSIFGLLAWALIWKGLALWKSARRGQNIWFVALLVINTLGILEILYLYVFSKKFKPVSKD